MPIAIDIGSRTLHLVQGSASAKEIMIKQMICEPLAFGLVQDGIIREFGGLEMAVKNMLSKHKIRDRACLLTLYGSHVYSRELDLPTAKAKDLDKIVSFEVQSSLGNNREVVVEYIVAKARPTDQPDKLHIRAAALQTSYVNDYYRLLRNCRLSPVALDLQPNSLAKLLNSRDINGRPLPDGKNVMFLDIGGVTTTAHVYNSGEVTYSRIIPIGGSELERAVNQNNKEAPPDRQLLIKDMDFSPDRLRENTFLTEPLRNMVATVSDGVQRIQQFLAGRQQGGRVEQVFIYGYPSTLKGLDKLLGEALILPVETVRELGHVHLSAQTSLAPCLNAVGALIRLQ